MTRNQALSEIRNKKNLADSGFWLTFISCILMAAGLLGFAMFFDLYIIDSTLFSAGVLIFVLTLIMNGSAKKRGDKIFTENFIVPEIERYFSDVKAHDALPVTVKQIKELGFFKNLQWSEIDGHRSFSASFGDIKMRFCELGIYNLFSVGSKTREGKSLTEKDYVFRGRYFDIETEFSEEEAEEKITKAERYNLCNTGSVRAEYKDGHFYIFHNVYTADDKFRFWLAFPYENPFLDAEGIESAVRADFEPYATMLRYIL